MSLIPTFNEFRQIAGVPDDSSSADIDVLWARYDEYVYELIETMTADPCRPGTVSVMVDVLAQSVIEDHLGVDWYQANVIESASSRNAREYLHFGDNGLGKALAIHRTRELARRLYQLQSFPWFDQLVAKVRRDQLSGASFELDVVWVLQILAQRVSARETQNRLGSDFDISADIGDLTIPVEVKAKDDTTPYSSSTVVQTVRHAARQLPMGKCGILFIRVPSTWLGGRLEADYNDALAEGTRQTSRIGVVITAIDKPHIKKNGQSGSVTRVFDYFKHPECQQEVWAASLRFKTLWDADLTILAPRRPF